jgi:hypothetical protein
MALKRDMVEQHSETRKRVSLAPVFVAPREEENEEQEQAARLAEAKVIRSGRDSWENITKSDCFESWTAIGARSRQGIRAKSEWRQCPMGAGLL